MVRKKSKPEVLKSKDIRRDNLLSFCLILVIILVANIISGYLFTRIDLTSEKRYTLAPATKALLRSVDDYVFFRIYLEGDFPAGFKKLRRETKEMLDEFRAYNKLIGYEFVNPLATGNARETEETIKTLTDKGLRPTELQVRATDGAQQKLIFPGALVMYRDKELPLDLLDQQLNTPPEMVINNSVQNLEFKLADIIRKLSQLQKPAVAFIEGHGELNEAELHDLTQALLPNYRVDHITIAGRIYALTRRSDPDANGNVRILPNYEAIIIAKPSQPFDEKDKFIIDQYIMYGGKVLWLVDPVFASMDSLQMNESTVGVDLDLKLDDMFFKYGLRLNKNLVLDVNSASIPLRTGQVGGQAQIEFFRWPYFPLLNQASNHPIVRNINSIKSDFVSSIDTTSAENIRKTPLLKTSDYSRISLTPVLISLAMLRENPDPRMYNKQGQITAYLLEGTFSSLFANRIPPEIAESREIGFKEESKPTAMIVVADGDLARNQFHVPRGYPLPLGYDQYTRRTYGNKDFMLNAISYLADETQLISIRSREIKMRLLDMNKAKENRLNIQIINLVIPVVIVILIGIALGLRRKRRYQRRHISK
ncbi:MAG: gliding motility-associated ABC transporter substrate-binding protein GldG [Bacteroidia bacterium]|jgi:ABC-2 type transport system permease protein|nr:gliding motility-associated ABC transporter substrate-binding protein GldG [Bacteroidia bacterium]